MKTLRFIAAAMAATLILAACSGGDDATSTAGADVYDSRYAGETPSTTMLFDQSDSDGATGAPASAEDAAGTNAQAIVDTVDAISLGRQIIFTANLHIEVDDVVAAGAEVENAIAGLGGILFGQETTTGDNPRSILTIKVLPANFDDALDRLAGVGELVSQSVFADDVTDRVVDLESRIATAEISVARLQTLLDGAVGIEDVVALETELLQRETDLEVLRGQLRTLGDAVSLATIVVVLTEPEPDVPEPALELTQTAYAGIDTASACPGTEELTIDEGEPMTVCFEILNTGDTALADIRLRDYGLDMDEGDTIVVEGDLSVPLQPGDRIILAFQTEADPDQYSSVEISATPVDEDGDPLRIGAATEVHEVGLTIIRDDSLPGFQDSLSAAWDAFLKVVGVVVLGAGAIIPFLWVPILAGGVWWWRKRRPNTTPTS
jgi:hypothetical protein